MHEKVTVLEQTNELRSLMTILRDRQTKRSDWIFSSERVIRLLIEEALNHLPFTEKTVTTPTGHEYKGVDNHSKICGVSIMRAGESMEVALGDSLSRSVRIGKILIQRNEETAEAKLFYHKLPVDIHERYVLLLDPMLGTGGSAIKAIETLTQHKVEPCKVIFVNLLAAPEGIENLHTSYPDIQIVTAGIDKGLDSRKFIVPGLGDFGCRYFCTDAGNE